MPIGSVSLDASGSSGGILIAWKLSKWKLEESWSRSFSISVILTDISSNQRCLISSVYGPTLDSSRADLWSKLTSFRRKFQGPYGFIGDFNITRYAEEKSHGRIVSSIIRSFSNWIDDLQLVDLPLLGSRLTWTNCRLKPSLSRLDRFLLSPDWLETYPSTSQTTLPRSTSDHCLIMLSSEDLNWGPKPFRFESSWLNYDGFFQLVSDWWGSFQVEGYAGYNLCTKLRRLKTELKRWNKDVLSKRELTRNLSRLKFRRSMLQRKKAMSLEILAQRIQLIQSLSARALDNEIAWKQRSHAKWLKEGDNNSKFFHSIASMHARCNRISYIHVKGRRIEDKEEISKEAILHFISLLSADGWDRPGLDSLHFNNLSPLDVDSLVAPFSEEEVKTALNSLGSDKAPGPDGFPLCFFIFFGSLSKQTLCCFSKNSTTEESSPKA
ncbi:uncharacterized protein LOC131239172 [Magnolia sinica]|uniref:uncharacterized protein LOC131239172 n=1 Tax=Magnolia sinica TaxID=86752 RepID=UPI00265B4858|nr:uncharacterized protein LOC131239172 [Magnolia sinica]